MSSSNNRNPLDIYRVRATFDGGFLRDLLIGDELVTYQHQGMDVPYSTYYKPMGDLSYISSEQGGGLIIHHGLIMRIIIIYKRPIPIQ